MQVPTATIVKDDRYCIINASELDEWKKEGWKLKDEPKAELPNLDKLTKAELLALATERGVAVDPAATKAVIVAAIEAVPAAGGANDVTTG